MGIVEKIGERQRLPAVLGEAGDAGNQPRRVAVGGADVLENDLRRLLFQLDVTTLWRGSKAGLDFAADAVRRVAQQRSKLVLKIVSLVGLTDEIQYGQAYISPWATKPSVFRTSFKFETSIINDRSLSVLLPIA